MVNMEIMSDNLTLLINELISNQKICKYLYYNQNNPLSQPDLVLPANKLVMSKIHPYPFDPVTQEKDAVEIRVYYPEGGFDGSKSVLETFLYFDIICAKSLWLVSDEKSAIRPYMIMKYLFDHFNKVSIGTLGRIKFTNFAHLHINQEFDCIRLESSIVLFGA